MQYFSNIANNISNIRKVRKAPYQKLVERNELFGITKRFQSFELLSTQLVEVNYELKKWQLVNHF